MSIVRTGLLWVVLIFVIGFIVSAAGGVGTIEFLIIALITAPLAWWMTQRYEASKK